ncbi:MAG: PIG-L family deacetylase [Candidatus Methanoperedens sp.]|nr:PIG-L family deacetylase [Candidatus Methanoperedens sp.]
MVMDPVCGMMVDKKTAQFKPDHKGTTYPALESEPEKYPKFRQTAAWSDVEMLVAAAPWALRSVPRPDGPVDVDPPAGRRWLVVSPHLDDGVLSLGAFIARHVGEGGEVTVLTVLAGRPDAGGPAGAWDAASGFDSEAEAAIARRWEDRNACADMGATVEHIEGADEQYVRDRDSAPVVGVVRAMAHTYDEILLPGFPLANDDHLWVADTVGGLLVSEGVGFRLYAEEPYTADGAPVRQPSWAHDLSRERRWSVLRPTAQEQIRKVRAVARYRSQLPLLAPPARIRTPGGTASRALGQVWAAARRGEWISAPVAVTGSFHNKYQREKLNS